MSRDPMRYDAGDVNLYRFALNNILTMIDPLGLETICTNGPWVLERQWEQDAVVLLTKNIWAPIGATDYGSIGPGLIGDVITLLNDAGMINTCKCIWKLVGIKEYVRSRVKQRQSREKKCYESNCESSKVEWKEIEYREVVVNDFKSWRDSPSLFINTYKTTNGTSFPNSGVACGCDITSSP